MTNERNHDVEVVLLCRIGTFQPEWMNVCGNRKSVVGWNLCFFSCTPLEGDSLYTCFFFCFLLLLIVMDSPYITKIRGLNNRQKQSHHFLTDQICHFVFHLIQLLLGWGAITPPHQVGIKFQQGLAQIGSVPRRTIYV